MADLFCRRPNPTSDQRPRASGRDSGTLEALRDARLGRWAVPWHLLLGAPATAKCLAIALMLSFVLPTDADAGLDEARAAYASRDFDTAFKEYLPLAKKGDAEAQHHIGLTYEKGLGRPKDYAEAAEWFQRAAEQGYPDAQFSLGFLYVKGTGVIESFPRAYMWWSLAAEAGHERAARVRDVTAKDMTSRQLEQARELLAQRKQKNQ